MDSVMEQTTNQAAYDATTTWKQMSLYMVFMGLCFVLYHAQNIVLLFGALTGRATGVADEVINADMYDNDYEAPEYEDAATDEDSNSDENTPHFANSTTTADNATLVVVADTEDDELMENDENIFYPASFATGDAGFYASIKALRDAFPSIDLPSLESNIPRNPLGTLYYSAAHDPTKTSASQAASANQDLFNATVEDEDDDEDADADKENHAPQPTNDTNEDFMVQHEESMSFIARI